MIFVTLNSTRCVYLFRDYDQRKSLTNQISYWTKSTFPRLLTQILPYWPQGNFRSLEVIKWKKYAINSQMEWELMIEEQEIFLITHFYLCFFVEWHINLCGLYDAKEEQQWSISQKVNVIAQLEFELIHFEIVVQHVRHFATGTSSFLLWLFLLYEALSNINTINRIRCVFFCYV